MVIKFGGTMWMDYWPALLMLAALIAAIALIETRRPGAWQYLRKRPYRYEARKRKPPPSGAFQDWRVEDWLFAVVLVFLLTVAGTSVSLWMQSMVRTAQQPGAHIVMTPEQLAAHDRTIIEAVERKVSPIPAAAPSGYALSDESFTLLKHGALATFFVLLWLSLVARKRRGSRL